MCWFGWSDAFPFSLFNQVLMRSLPWRLDACPPGGSLRSAQLGSTNSYDPCQLAELPSARVTCCPTATHTHTMSLLEKGRQHEKASSKVHNWNYNVAEPAAEAVARIRILQLPFIGQTIQSRLQINARQCTIKLQSIGRWLWKRNEMCAARSVNCVKSSSQLETVHRQCATMIISLIIIRVIFHYDGEWKKNIHSLLLTTQLEFQ